MFDGVHGATAGIAPTLPHFDSPTHKVAPGNLGNVVSKLLLWEKVADLHDEVLLLENDAVPCQDFVIKFREGVSDFLPADWQVVHVGHCCGTDKPTRVVNDRVSEIRHPFCCHAVLWKREALRVAISEFKRTSWNSPSDIILAKKVYPQLRHYSFTPPLVTTDETLSEIAASWPRWDSLDGWFDFGRVYDDALNRVAGPAAFVEVGCWHGRSTAYMAEEIKRRMLPVTFYAVDTWKGNEDNGLVELVRRDHGGDLFPTFVRNMSRVGVYDYITPIQEPSTTAAARFPDRSLDFVFLDGDHTFEGVAADLRAWGPKIKPGGCLAGHDIDYPTVHRAVEEGFPGRWHRWERCWLVYDPNRRP